MNRILDLSLSCTIIILLFMSVLQAGDADRINANNYQPWARQGTPFSGYHGQGFTDFASLEGTSFYEINPAALAEMNAGWLAGVNWEYETAMHLSDQFDLDVQRYSQWLPLSGGVAWGGGGFGLGLSYNSCYNMEYLYGDILFTSLDGTEETIQAEKRQRVDVLSFSGALALGRMIPAFNKFRFGIEINHEFYQYFEKIFSTEFDLHTSDWSYTYALDYQPEPEVTLTVLYHTGLSREVPYIIHDLVFVGNSYETSYLFYQPEKYFAGLSHQVNPEMRYTLSAALIRSKPFEEQTDLAELSGRLLYRWNDKVQILGGVASQGAFPWLGHGGSAPVWERYALTLGLNRQVGPVDLTFTLSDSHLFSESPARSTQIQFGLGWSGYR